MNIDFELYRIFYVVANNHNITKASKELLISQPAVTKSIKKLEDSLGGQLFIRTKKGVSLTEEGKEIYYYIKNAIEYINNAEKKFTNLKKLETGTIRIGVSTTLAKNFFISYLKEFHELYPNITIEIKNSLTSELLNDLKRGSIDIVILNLPYEERTDIKFIPIKEIHDCFVASKKFEQLKNKTIDINDLNKYPIILQKKESSTGMFLNNFLSKNNLSLKSDMNIASYSLSIELIKIGLGIGLSTKEYIKQELSNGDLFEIKTLQKIPTRYIGFATKRNSIPSFCTKKLIELIKK